MIYTATQGVQHYNKRLHYSLYGGVEYFPNYSLAWKELLPLAVVPVVTIALLVAITSFHVPSLTTPGKGKATGASGTSKGVLSALTASKDTTSSNPQQAGSTPASSAPVVASGPAVATTDNFLPVSTVSSGSGSGNTSLPAPVVGGLGSGGGGTTLPGTGTTTPTPVPDTSTTVEASTPLVDGDATVNTQQPQASIDITVPLTNTQLSAGLSL